MVSYDYIIAGAGAGGLSLLMRMIHSGQFTDKKILLVDKGPKNRNDRTWCFWEEGEGFFDPIVFRRWDELWFHTHAHSKLHRIFPYRYKLIKGIDFYNYCFQSISTRPNISVRYGDVQECFSSGNETGVVLNGEKIYSTYVFNSIIFPNSLVSGKHHHLLQHFKGWIIGVAEPVFNHHQATLMDFRVPQTNGTSFVYIMPFSDSEALVEYTVFSEKLLEDSIYEEQLASYCKDVLHLHSYTITEKETGVIPMTNYPFQTARNNIINIGTAGGQTKASSGYTFQFIQRQSTAIVDALLTTGRPFVKQETSKKRFDFYDSVLLNILAGKKVSGEIVFEKLIEKNSLRAVMKFLENRSSFIEDLKLIRFLPKRKFMRAAVEEILGISKSKIQIQKL